MKHTNHEPNAKVWTLGDLVIHDDDAKRPDMLMRVLGRIASGPRKGMFRTQYFYPEHQPKAWRKKVWVNPGEKLHDPARFAIDTTRRPTDRFSRDLAENAPRSRATVTRLRPAALSPYHEALEWIEEHRGAGSASRLARLILSLWNSEACFSFRECIDSLDAARTDIAIRCVTKFATEGETDELVRVGYRIHALFPLLWDIGQAGTEAKRATRSSFEKARANLAYDRDTGNPDTDGRP